MEGIAANMTALSAAQQVLEQAGKPLHCAEISKRIVATDLWHTNGSLGSHEQGLIITTSDFSKGARQEAERADAVPVGLMGGDQLVRLLVENDIGVSRNSHDVFELGTDDADES